MASFLSQIAKITDNLYLSSFIGATEFNVNKFNITCIISVCKEVPKFEHKNVECIKLEVMDKPTESLSRYFDFVADKIKEVTDKNGICLVHCVAGVSRSATMVLVYLMKHFKMPLRDAHSLVKSKRPFIRPNLGFWRQMVEYEQKLFGKTSIKIVQSNIGFIPDIYENEVKSMMWARSNPAAVSGTFGYNTNQNGNMRTNGHPPPPQQQPMYKEKSYYHQQNGQKSNQPPPIEPVIGNAIPKLSQNFANKLVISSNGAASGSSNKAQSSQVVDGSPYSTTYRTSYQKH